MTDSSVELDIGGDRLGPIVRTAAALLSVQGVTWTTSLVGALVVPRFLGASNLGLFASAATLASIVVIAATFGTSSQIVKAVARDRTAAPAIVLHAIAIRTAIWAAFMIPTTVAALMFVDGGLPRFVLLAIVGMSVFGLIGDAAFAGLQGNQTLGRASVLTSLIGVAVQIATAVVLMAGGGIVWLVALAIVAAPLGAIIPIAMFWNRLGAKVAPSRTLAVGLLSAGVPFLTWDLALKLYGSIDYLLLAALTTSTTVGEYAFAYRLAGIPLFATTVVAVSIYPALAAAAGRDPQFFRDVATNATRIVILATFPMTVGLMLLAPYLTKLIGGGGQFDEATPLIVILSLHVPLVAMDTILGTVLFAMDRQKKVAAIGCVAAVLNPLCNLVAIPLTVRWFGNGAIGASVITVGTECFVGIGVWAMLGSGLDRRRLVRVAGLAALACLPMAVVVFAITSAFGIPGVAAAIPAGVGVYFVCILALRAVSVTEARELRASFAAP